MNGGSIEGGDAYAKSAQCVGKVGRRIAEMPAELNPTRAHPSDLNSHRYPFYRGHEREMSDLTDTIEREYERSLADRNRVAAELARANLEWYHLTGLMRVWGMLPLKGIEVWNREQAKIRAESTGLKLVEGA